MKKSLFYVVLVSQFAVALVDAQVDAVKDDIEERDGLEGVDLESYVDQFDGGFDLKWDIVREERDAYSLETAPGELVLQTLYGSIVKTYGNNAKNMFLVEDPIGVEDPFEMTILVTQFDPTQAYQQIALLAYQDDAHFLKFSYEHHGSADGTGLHRCHEVDTESKFHGVPIEFDGPFWLRMTRNIASYQLAYSDDGDEFKTVDTVAWKADAAAGSMKVGFVAKNGTSRADSTSVSVEYFQLLKPRSE